MPAGRITQQTIASTALRGLQANLSRMQSLQNQLSSGKQISKPSDDPSGTVSAMTLRSRRAADEQYLRNIDIATGRLTVTDNALTQLAGKLTDVRNLIVQARNGALGSESLSAVAAEVNSIRGEMLDLYNTTYLDRPVFGGTVNGQSAIDAAGNFVGDNGAVSARISTDAVVRVDVTGTAAGADTIPGMISQVATNIATVGGTDADLTNLDGAISQVLQALGDVGARSARIAATRDTVDSQRLDLTSQISVQEDVDMPQAIMNLSAQQVGYQAALQSAAKIQQVSLVDFLK